MGRQTLNTTVTSAQHAIANRFDGDGANAGSFSFTAAG